ncbi:MAG: chromate transporter [Devosia indica]
MNEHNQPSVPATRAFPSLAEAIKVWARIGLLSFGGPAGQIALMHRILVEEKRWLGEQRFLHALNFCMLLPGPEAQQLAVYIGWLMHKTLGGFIAGLLFVLPGVLAIMVLSWVYALYGNVGFVEALFYGLKAAVLAIVVHALARIGSRALRSGAMVSVAALSFIAIFAFDIPFPLIIAAAGIIGYMGHRAGIKGFSAGAGHGSSGKTGIEDADTHLGETIPAHARVDTAWAMRISSILLVLWLAPTVILIAIAGWDNVFTAIAIFFSQMAVVTFGGAYAVLAYVAQQAVEHYGWLQPGEMLDGLGMAETTPGPLIMVTQFVGFMGAFREPGAMPPLLAGTLGGLLTTWVTFTPCFLWIFLGAPFVERLRENRSLAAALSTITAAVVGVVLNLAVWFGLHVIFRDVSAWAGYGLSLDVPVWSSIDPIAAVLVAASMIAMFRFKLGVVPLLAGAASAGLIAYAAGVV